MANTIKLTLPIYHQTPKGSKLLGMNNYERMHYQPRNKLKKLYYALVRAKVGRVAKVQGAYTAEYKLYYKNPISDAPNIIAIIDKLLMDGLQECGAIENDNVKFYKGAKWSVAGQDKINPRVEIIITKIDLHQD